MDSLESYIPFTTHVEIRKPNARGQCAIMNSLSPHYHRTVHIFPHIVSGLLLLFFFVIYLFILLHLMKPVYVVLIKIDSSRALHLLCAPSAPGTASLISAPSWRWVASVGVSFLQSVIITFT